MELIFAKIALIGAMNNVGQEIIRQASETKDQLKVLVTNPNTFPYKNQVEVVHGSFENASEVEACTKDCDVIVSTISNVTEKGVMLRAAKICVEAANDLGKKLVFVTTYGIESNALLFKHFASFMIGKQGFEDFERADEYVREHAENYVLVRPTALNDKPAGGDYELFSGSKPVAPSLSRGDLAAFLLRAAKSSEWDNQAVQICGKK